MYMTLELAIVVVYCAVKNTLLILKAVCLELLNIPEK